MTTQQIADRLYELCSQGKYGEAQQELYSNDAVSTEPDKAAAQCWEVRIQGRNELNAKGEKWRSMTEAFHGCTATKPIVTGNFIAMGMSMDTTMKGMPRNQFHEMAVFEVKDGKIISEEFFY